jgi:hypothetical protein
MLFAEVYIRLHGVVIGPGAAILWERAAGLYAVNDQINCQLDWMGWIESGILVAQLLKLWEKADEAIQS